MASIWYTPGILACLDGTVNLQSDTLKIMLVDSTYDGPGDMGVAWLAYGFAGDIINFEIDVDGYVPGYGGAGRRTLTHSLDANLDEHEVNLVFTDVTWSNLGVGATIGGAVIFKEGASDAASPVIGFIDVADIITNTGNVTIDFSATGNLRIQNTM